MVTRKQIQRLRIDTARVFPFDIGMLAVSIPISVEKRDYLVRVSNNRIVLSETLFSDYSYKAIRQAFIHGLMYILLKHKERGDRYTITDREKFLWAIASEACRCDVLIHILLHGMYGDMEVVSPWELPFVTVDQINKTLSFFGFKPLPSHPSVEQIYFSLKQLDNIAFKPVTEIEDDYDNDYAFDSIRETTVKEMVKKAFQTFSRGLASAHDEFEYLFSEYLKNITKDVYRLRSVLHSLSGQGKGDYKVGSKSRRRNPTTVKLMQVHRSSYGRIAVIADVSGSTEGHRDRLFSALAAAIKACDRIDVYIGDSAILEKKVGVHNLQQIRKIPTGYGTDMAAIMKEIDTRGYNSIVVVTDGQTPWPDKMYTKTYYFPFGNFTLEGVPPWIKIV